MKKLDRELAPIWSGSVIATDGGGREGSTQLVINIQDSNDNSPKFAAAVHSASVVESAPAGTFVYKVEARDLDNGLNGEIRYEIKTTKAEKLASFKSTKKVAVFQRLKKLIGRQSKRKFRKTITSQKLS